MLLITGIGKNNTSQFVKVYYLISSLITAYKHDQEENIFSLLIIVYVTFIDLDSELSSIKKIFSKDFNENNIFFVYNCLTIL